MVVCAVHFVWGVGCGVSNVGLWGGAVEGELQAAVGLGPGTKSLRCQSCTPLTPFLLGLCLSQSSLWLCSNS